MGLSREDLRPGLRCFVVTPYVVFYRPAVDTIEVLRILHGARDVRSVLEPENERGHLGESKQR